MNLIITGFYVAFIQVFDLLFNVVALKYFGFTVIELGFLNGVWTSFFIIGLKLSNKYNNNGYFRRSVLTSYVCMVFSIISLLLSINIGYKIILYIGYVFHGIALSTARNGLFGYLLEEYEGSKWFVVNKRFLQNILFLEGLLLVIIGVISINLLLSSSFLIVIASLFIGSLALINVSNVHFLIEKKLFSMENRVRDALRSTDTLLSIGYQITFLPPGVVSRENSLEERRMSSSILLISLLLVKISSEYVFTTLPYHMYHIINITYEGILSVYGFAKILGVLLMFTGSERLLSRGVLALSMIGYLSSITMIFCYAHSLLSLAIWLSLLYASKSIIDTILYNKFIEITYGYGTGRYMLVNEIGSFLGSMSSGLIYFYMGITAIILINTLSSLTLTPILRNSKRIC